jgi:hypothetical protein
MPPDPTIPPSASRLEPEGDGLHDARSGTDGFKPSLQAAIASLHEAKAYFLHMLYAKADAAKASLRLLVLYALLGVFGILVAGTIAITSTVLLVVGVAGGLAQLLDGRTWLANLIVGVSVIVVASLGMTFGYRLMTGRFARAVVTKYEAMMREQKTQFGHDVEEKAHESRAHQ